MDQNSKKTSASPNSVFPSQQPYFPSVTSPSINPPIGYSEIPVMPTQSTLKQRSNTYQDMKLILRDKPTTVYCPTCNRNVVSNLKGKKTSLIVLCVLILFLLIALFYLLDEFEYERSLIITGFLTILGVVSIIAGTVFKLSYHHVCPLCGRDLGNKGDVVSRQILNIVAA